MHAQATYYGQQVDQDEAGTCSFGRNLANTMKMPWTSDVRHSVALNDNMFNDSLPCGTCIMYRGTGQGLGTTPIPTTNWTKAIVNNRCASRWPALLATAFGFWRCVLPPCLAKLLLLK